MIVYWCLFLIIILIQLIPVSADTGNRAKLILSFLLMFIYASIRVAGDDYFAYEEIFYYAHNPFGSSTINDRIEPGFLLLNKLMPSYRSLIVFLSAFTCFTYYWMFRKLIPPKYYWLGFVLMAMSGGNMLIFQLSGLRNAIAINIMALSFFLIKQRRIIPYLGLTILAYFFHNSAAFFMPLAYFVATPNKIKTRDIVIWSMVVLFLFSISAAFLIESISTFINLYFEQYGNYLLQAFDKIYTRSILMYSFVSLLFAISFIVMQRDILDEIDNMILKLTLLFFVSLMLGSLNFRMSQYFAPYIIVGTTIVMKRVRKPILKYGYLTAITLFLWYSFFVVFLSKSVYEYHTIFE